MELSKSPAVYALWTLVLGGVGYLVATHRIEWPMGAAFLVTLGLPSVLGAKKVDP